MKTYRSQSINYVLRKRSLASAMRNESGVALIITLILLTVIAAIIPAAMNMTRDDFSRTSNYVDSREMFYVAEAGLEHAKFLTIANTMNGVLEGPDGLQNTGTTSDDDDNGTFGVGTLFTGPDGEEYDQVSYNGANYYIRGYDNDDGDGDINVDLDGIIFIQSVGVSPDGTTTKVITAMTELFNLPPTTFPSAVSLVGPVSNITSTGSGFNVEGGKSVGGTITHGYALDGSADTSCAATNGIASESAGPGQFVANASLCTEPTCVILSGGAGNKIKGVDGGSPDIGYGQSSFTAQDAEDLHAMLTAPGIPDQTFTGPHTGASKISGTQTWGSLTDPVTIYFDDDVDIAGNITGYGVLIVDGDLDINGSLDWNGIILVGSCSTCDGALVGTGSASVYGAMVVGNSIDAAVNFTGNANIRYSCAGIDLANGVFDFTFNTVSWNEQD